MHFHTAKFLVVPFHEGRVTGNQLLKLSHFAIHAVSRFRSSKILLRRQPPWLTEVTSSRKQQTPYNIRRDSLTTLKITMDLGVSAVITAINGVHYRCEPRPDWS